MSASDFYIPIEKEIDKFAQHLSSHHRTILSARFGDGKSFFLDKFEKDKRVLEEYKFIKVYPVNYQIANNTDIFTLLKYDILLQLLVNNMVSEEVIKDTFIGVKDCAKFLEAFLDGVAFIDPTPSTILTKSFLLLLKEVEKLSERWMIRNGGKQSARTLIKKIENSQPFYFEDDATKLIRQSLREWRNKKKQRVVLVVEDLDRLDPAHLFRILNVFSAHMDFIYRNGDTPNESLVGSRFGFDSIIFILEYENLKRLFTHFYGDGASFSGYINKFIPQGYFEYSLRRSANSYFYENVSKITGMNQDYISTLLSPVIDIVTLRDMAFSLKDIENQVTLEQKDNIRIGFLFMVVIMKRLGMNNTLISNTCKSVYKRDPIQFARYIFDFTKLDGFSDQYGRLKLSNTIMYYEVDRAQDGFANLGKAMPVPDQMRTFSMHVFMTKLMQYVKE